MKTGKRLLGETFGLVGKLCCGKTCNGSKNMRNNGTPHPGDLSPNLGQPKHESR